MKARDIYNKIRKIYLRNIVLPIAAIIIPWILITHIPFDKILKPKVVYSVEEAIRAVEDGNYYLELSVEKLIYSGYDYMRDENVYGQYYYEIVNGEECVFFLMEPNKGESKETYIYNVNRRVKVEATNGIFDNMVSMFANSIGWTEDGVRDITKGYVFSEMTYHYNVFLSLYVLLLATLVYGILLLVYSFIIIVCPILCPRIIIAKLLFRSGRHSNLFKFVEIVARETEAEDAINIGSMYITKHFILNLDSKDFDLVPIDRIIIAYEHSTLKSFLGMHLKVTYTLHLKCSKLFRFHIPKKTLEEANSVLDYIKANKPDTLVGYTSGNKELVKEIVNSSK